MWVKCLNQVTRWALYQQTLIINTRLLKQIIKLFDSWWNYIPYAFIKLISLLVIWSWKFDNMLKNKIKILQTAVNQLCAIVFNIFPHWISKPCIQKDQNHSKASIGVGRFSQNLLSLHTRSHDSTSKIVNQEDTINVTLSDVVNQNTKPLPPTFHILVWRLMEGQTVKQKLFLLVDGIKYFLLLIFVNMLLFVDLQKWNRRFCWISNNNTLDIPCTPNAQEARWQSFEFDFAIPILVIWIYRTVANPMNWKRTKRLFESLLILD